MFLDKGGEHEDVGLRWRSQWLQPGSILHACRAQLSSFRQRTDEHQSNGERKCKPGHRRRISTTTRASGSFELHPLHAFQASHVDPNTTHHWLTPGNRQSTHKEGHMPQQTHVYQNHREPVEETSLSISNALNGCRLEPCNSARARHTKKNNLVSSEHKWATA